MYRILEKETLSPGVKRMVIGAPLIARKALPGEFVMLRTDGNGERIPLTIADFDRARGTITVVFQEVGATTKRLGEKEAGEALTDFAGPLGQPTKIKALGTVVCVGGGIGVAPVYPIARGMKEAGNRVISIIGAKTRDMLILEKEMRAVSDILIVTTDDGSYGRKGFVTDAVRAVLDSEPAVAEVIAIGPVPMMRAVAEATRPRGIKTVVSLNPIMVDGTGMCGGCRVSVGGVTKFVCVDGPEFDGHEVDFAGLTARQRMYADQEKRAAGHGHSGGNCGCQC